MKKLLLTATALMGACSMPTLSHEDQARLDLLQVAAEESAHVQREVEFQMIFQEWAFWKMWAALAAKEGSDG